MNETTTSIMTCILIKQARGIKINSFDKEYLLGVLEAFDELSTKEQEYMMYFTDMLESQIKSEEGKLN
jgi:hypothetical protein